jgi:hypothetical protein
VELKNLTFEWIETTLSDSREIVARMCGISFEQFQEFQLDESTESYLKYSLEFISRSVEFNFYNL